MKIYFLVHWFQEYMKKVFICEKPSVAEAYAKVLGVTTGRKNGCIENDQYIITWAVGHLVTLCYPEAYDSELSKWTLDTIPFIPSRFKYQVIENVKEQFENVRNILQRDDIDVIYNAGDSAREGEYIQRLIFQMAKPNPKAKIMRIWIDSQTEEAIRNGIRDAVPQERFNNLAASAYERAIEDWLSGINFSRACTLKYRNLLGAFTGDTKGAIAVGRVMTSVLGMIVEKERQVRNFTESFSYGISGTIQNGVEADWAANEPDSAYFESPMLVKPDAFLKKEHADILCNQFSQNGKLILLTKEKKNQQKKAPLLFNLAELQAECTKRYKISPDETLDIAQSLYEKKLTTYPRTDARVLSTPVAVEIDKNIRGLSTLTAMDTYVENILSNGLYMGLEKTKYVDDSKVSDHYAIIPTGETANYGTLNELERNVYHLIIQRFLSIFYPAAIYSKLSVIFKQGTEKFYTSATFLSSAGYLEILGLDEEDEKELEKKDYYKILDDMQEGTIYDAQFGIVTKKSAPPKRYTSGSIVLAMESAGKFIEDPELRAQINTNGIGTSATRAETIKKLIKINYISLNKKTQILQPTELGELIYTVIAYTEPKLLNPELTANWEKGLSQVEHGQITAEVYRQKLASYISTLTNSIKAASNYNEIKDACNEVHYVYTGKRLDLSNVSENSGYAAKYLPDAAKCPVCGKRIKVTKNGYMCENYKNPCNFYAGAEINGAKVSETQMTKILSKGESDELTFKKKDGSGTYKHKLIVTEWNGRKVIGLAPFEKRS